MGLKVDTTHPQYEAYRERWTRCRDCAEGGDAVKAKGTLYLPALDTQTPEPQAPGASPAFFAGTTKYQAYLQRALFYNATSRTIEGFSGAVFQKNPVVKVPKKYAEDLEDITLTETSFNMFALDVLREILTTGRIGVLVDMPPSSRPTLDPEIRPYMTYYMAEDIVNWDTERINGRETLTLLVLRETTKRPTDDKFVKEAITYFRVFELIGGACFSSLWYRQDGGTSGEWVEQDATPLLRLGKPVPFIPFQFIGAHTLSPSVGKPPMIDLVDLNLSHYRTSADLEHGRHFTALPQPYVSGMPPGAEPVAIGAGGVWCLEKDGEAGMLEFKGEGLGALVTADQEKRKMMATLGARLLEEQGGPAETATAVQMRHAGEQASLKKIVGLLEVGLEHSLQTFCWWKGEGEKPSDIDADVTLNRDFFALRMSAEDLKGLILAVQAGTMSFKTFWYNLELGEIARPGVTAEEEQKQIEEEKPEPIMPPPAAPGAAPAPGEGDEDDEGAPPPAGGGKAVVPPGTHLVKDAGTPGAPKANAKPRGK